jgi:hypothetical protein
MKRRGEEFNHQIPNPGTKEAPSNNILSHDMSVDPEIRPSLDGLAFE